MKRTQTAKKNAAPAQPAVPAKPLPRELPYYLPPGMKLSDVYMDVQQVLQELNISKRTLQNLRNKGILSFTWILGKIYYIRQEIASILAGNIQWGKFAKHISF